MSLSYEQLRDQLEALEAGVGQERHLKWLANELAVARNASNDFEVFLRGEELVAASPLVRRHLQHDEWKPNDGGEAFFATRIVLPSAEHFASVAALIAVELLRAGIANSGDPQKAFSSVEPIIEMAIRRGALPENVVIGLIGELVVLRQCLLATANQPTKRSLILETWQGWHEGRDFRFGKHAIEVKATQSMASIHEFSGMHQLEAQALPGGNAEQLHLLSVGLAASPSTGESLPAIVENIMALLAGGIAAEPSPLQQTFLANVRAYGSLHSVGYDHARMKQWSVYRTRYTHTFPPRLYRVDDPAMRLLTRDTLAQTYVDASSITFTLHLPEQVSAFNPAPNWQAEVGTLLTGLA